MREKITIRKYTLSDKDAIIDLFRLNTPTYFSTTEENELVHYLNHHAQNYYVIEYEDKLVGCGGINFTEDFTTGKISWDIMHPCHQGQGLGSQLLKYRVEKIMEYPEIKMVSVRTSQLVFKFYENFGFKLIEIIKDYWAEGFDLYRMEYPILNLDKKKE